MRAIKAQFLSGCSIADDGTRCSLSFLDSDGSEQTLDMSPACMRQLSLTLQAMVEPKRASRHRSKAPRISQPVTAWTAKSSPASEGAILTFMTPGQNVPIVFQISESGLVRLAEAIVEHELSAYPEGLHFT